MPCVWLKQAISRVNSRSFDYFSAMKTLALFLFPLSLMAQYSTPGFDLQGHRGARGLKPENTIPAFLTALDLGVTTIEMDLAVSKDGQLIVSHEPFMNPAICLTPDGSTVKSEDALKHNLYAMDYEEIRKWDCGSLGNPRFPEQEKIKIHKPLLRDVIEAVEAHIRSVSRYEVDYNVEIKSSPEGDNIFHPAPEAFSEMVVNTLDQYLPMERVTIQSFDFRILKYIHEHYPKVRLAALVENEKSIDENLKELGFIPDIYSPLFTLLTRDQVKYLHSKAPDGRKDKGLRVIPWTVNETKDMLVMKGMGVDGLITDYPDRAQKYKSTFKIPAKKE